VPFSRKLTCTPLRSRTCARRILAEVQADDRRAVVRRREDAKAEAGDPRGLAGQRHGVTLDPVDADLLE
jgi:hypothetical protein